MNGCHDICDILCLIRCRCCPVEGVTSHAQDGAVMNCERRVDSAGTLVTPCETLSSTP